MSETTKTPQPGWYPNEAGQQQWWDGTQWGPHAPAQAPTAPPKSVGIAYVLLIFLGGLGIHRFYLGQTGQGLRFLINGILAVVLNMGNGGGPFSSAGVIPSAVMLALMAQLLIELFQLKDAVRARNAQIAQGTTPQS